MEIQINRLPIKIVLYNNGCISFERLTNFATIVDSPEQGVQAILSNEDMYIGADTVIEYEQMYSYKQIPELLSWIKAQGMKMPRFK